MVILNWGDYVDNIINFNEKKEKIHNEKKLIEEEEKRLLDKRNIMHDIEFIANLFYSGKISDIEMIFTFQGENCYYGYRDKLEKEELKRRIDNVYKKVEFK